MNPLHKKHLNQAGFTLTELLVVLVVLSLIAAAITPQVLGRLDRSKVRAAQLQLETLGTSLDMYKIDAGSYPSTEHGLSALITAPDSMRVWDGPYVRSAKSIIDPWQREYIYEAMGSGYRLTTLGADGEIGGEGYDADLIFPDLSLTASGAR